MPLEAFPASYTTFEKIDISQLKPCFFHVSRLFSKKLGKTCKQRVSRRKVVFSTKHAKHHGKRSILYLKWNSGYYIIHHSFFQISAKVVVIHGFLPCFLENDRKPYKTCV